LQDRIHQPYRAPLCPLLPAMQERVGENGILGAALSGAGPSVLVFLDPKASTRSVKTKLARELKERGLAAELILTSITEVGACDSPGWKRRGPRSRQ
jgi:homoserine kinase